MEIIFYGAAGEVTGSSHLIKTPKNNILLDCGLFQGRRKETMEKNRRLEFDPGKIDNVILSHAHIDHSGRIPLLTKNGFIGRVICTPPTGDALRYLLPDSAHIQESDASYLNYKTLRLFLENETGRSSGKGRNKKGKAGPGNPLKVKGHVLDTEKIGALMKAHHLDQALPLYTSKDAYHALDFLETYPYNHTIDIGTNGTCTFYEAGHILGSALSMLTFHQDGRTYNICYTGDLGRFDRPIIKNPKLDFNDAHKDVDLLIMESTYGNRVHEPTQELKPALKNILNNTFNRGGTVIIPAFAFGRTQEILYVIHELYDNKEVAQVPVYIDSPLAANITRVFGEHPEVYDLETHKAFLEKGKNPFYFKGVHFVGSVEESMALNREEQPHIVISSSGMCEAGRILHHLRHKIHHPKHTILIVGYMAQHTLGRRILEQGKKYEEEGRKGPPPLLKILNKEYPLKAEVKKLGGFSAHADKNELLKFLNRSNLRIKQIAVVHGEEDQSAGFAELLKKNGYSVTVPDRLDRISV